MTKIGILVSLIILTTSSLFAQIPSITKFLPRAGEPGSTVTISGSNFDAVSSGNFVFFGSTRATVITASSIQLVVKVPSGAKYGPISVTVGSKSTMSSDYFVPTFFAPVGLSSSSFSSPSKSITGSPEGIEIGDVDGDGKPDLVVSNANNNTVSILANKTAEGSSLVTFASSVDFSTGLGSAPKNVVLADLDGDRRLDIVTANINNGTISIFRNISTSGTINGSSFGSRVNISVGGVPTDVKVSDINGDGKPDIAVLNAATSAISVLRNISNLGSITTGSFLAKVDFSVGSGPELLEIADLDGDNKPDLIASNSFDDTFSVLQNVSTSDEISSASFLPKIDFPTGNFPTGIAVGDIDGDGKKEIVISNYVNDNSFSIFRNVIENGLIAPNSFLARVNFTTGGAPYGIELADVNGDGKLDVVDTNNSGSTITIFINQAAAGQLNSSSFSSGVDFDGDLNSGLMAIADLTADGKPEIAIAGTGTKNSVTLLTNVLGIGVDIPPTVAATPASQVICTGSATDILLSNPNKVVGTSYSWTVTSSAGLSGAVPGTGNSIGQTLTASSPLETATYKVTPIANGVSGQAINVTITVVNSTPPPPEVISQVKYCKNEASVALSAKGTNLLWYTGDVGGIASPDAPTPLTIDAGVQTYFVSQLLSACGESPRAKIDVIVNAAPALVSQDSIGICTGVPIGYTPQSNVVGTTFAWTRGAVSRIFPVLGGGTGIINETLTNSTANAITANYKLVLTANGCSSAPANLKVTVNPSPEGIRLVKPVLSNVAIGDEFKILTQSSRIKAKDYTISISNGGLSPSAGNPSNASNQNENVLVDDAWLNNSNSAVDVVYSIIPATEVGCAGSSFTLTAKVQPPIVFNVAISSADTKVPPNSASPLNNGISTGPVLNSASKDRVLLGFTMDLANKINGINEPLLKEFVVSFGNPIATILKSIRLYQSENVTFDSKDVQANAVLSLETDKVIIRFTKPFDLSLRKATFFLVADVDTFVNLSTVSITPSLPMESIVLSRGTLSGEAISGRTYSFNDVTPPNIAKLVPEKRNTNFTTNSNLTIQFDEQVTSLDRKISIYTLDRVKVADLSLPVDAPSTGTTFSFPTNNQLKDLTNYYVNIASGSKAANVGFIDKWENGFLGIDNISDWSFKTVDNLAPEFVVTNATNRVPNLKNDIVDVTLLGANLQVALNKPGIVYYLVIPALSPPPSALQIYQPSTYPNTVVSAGNFKVFRDSALQVSPLSARFVDGTSYDVWLAAENASAVKMQDSGIRKLTFTATDVLKTNIVVSGPKNYTVCVGDFQPIVYPITISESKDDSFEVNPLKDGSEVFQSISVLVPQGFEFNISPAADTVISLGADVSISSFEYTSSSVFTVTFSVRGTTSRDKIILKGFEIRATGTAQKGDIYRLGGNGLKGISDFQTLGSLNLTTIPVVPLDIYDEARNQLLSSSISNGITKLSLRPRINIDEYGINQFSGPGVSEDQMDAITAGVGNHILSMVHSDRNGCTATVTREISIYDFTKAVNGLDTLYNSNHPVKISILRNGKGVRYSLESLTVSSATSASLGIDISTSLTGPINGNYVFNPKLFNTASNRAKFGILGGRIGQLLFLGKYRNLVTGELENFTQSVAIYVPPRPSLTINQSSATLVNLCENFGRAELNGLPKSSDNLTAFFTIDKTKVFPGLVDQFNGNGIVATDSVRKYKGYGVYTVRYIVQNTITKGTDTTSLTFRINPRPEVKFSWSNACVLPELVNFKNESTISSGKIEKNTWNFGDNSLDATSSQASPSHGFKDARTYSVSLEVESDLQCSSKFLTNLVPVGGNPDVNFVFAGISNAEEILFTDQSSVSGDKIKSRSWEFGDGLPAVGGNIVSVKRNFKNPGVYKVKLTATGEIGCVRTKTLDVGIVPKVVLAAESEVYEEFFNGSDGGWQTLRNPFNSVQSSSWKWLNANSIIDPNTNGSGILKTQNSKGSYDELEDSFLFSPVFDFSALKRPVISFDFYNQLSPSDGMVLEYSMDGKNIADPTKNWKFTLGETNLDNPTGFNWYNGTGLVTKPGDQPKGDYGWTQPETASKWVEARHSLDVVDQRKQVVFRFALGSSDQAKQGVGFAIDNVRIGSRTRTVLLENFTSLSNTVTDSRGNIEKAEKQLLMDDAGLGANIQNGVDVVRLNYHLSLPKEDPFNLDNPNELGARALFYNVTETPFVQMDGIANAKGPLFSKWKNDFKLKTLDLAEADVSVSAQIVKDEGEDKGAIKGTVFVKSRTKEGLPKDQTVLHIVLAEQKVDFATLSPQKKALVKTGEETSDYVVKKLYPTAAGTRFETDLKLNESRTFDFKWTPDFASFYPSDLTKPNLAIIAIVQNAFTKEVYQTAIKLNLEYPPLVTGIKEWATEEISCYPNPTDKQMMVSLPALTVQPIYINLLDQLGRVILQDQIAAGQKSKLLDTSFIADGIYLIELHSQGSSALRKRIVVQH
jgi:hypothetical protein